MTLEDQKKADNRPLKGSVSFRLNVLTSVLNRHAERYLKKQYGIAIPDWRVIATLTDGGVMSVRELSAQSKMDKAMVSRVVKRLIDSGHILSEPDPTDGRLLILKISSSGLDLHKRINPSFVERDERLLAVLEEQGEFCDSLDKLVEYVEKNSERFFNVN
jgi:DNA-binding MarR family transcriptional regulator